jgi:hypothetical protein
VNADDVQNASDSVDVGDVGDEDGAGGGGPDGEGGRGRMKYRDEEPSRRSGRYTRMTASRRASRFTERYISRRMAESNGVNRTGGPFLGDSENRIYLALYFRFLDDPFWILLYLADFCGLVPIRSLSVPVLI